MSEYNIINFELNAPQAKVITTMANQTWCPWARGTGKTTGVIAPWILHKVFAMPQSSGGLVGTSFEDLDTRILKAIFTAFNLFGLTEGVDYVYSKRPPDDWDKPFIPIPKKYDNVISFPNGTTMELISLSKMASANALNLQWLVGDEVKFFNEQKFNQEVIPILGRGNLDKEAISRSPWYGSLLMVTDKLAPNIHWILNKKKLHNERVANTVIKYQLDLNALNLKLAECEEKSRFKIKVKIAQIEKILSFLRRDLTQYIEAKSSENPFLTDNFFSIQKQNMTAYEYKIQIENENPTKAENGFYAARTEQHVYQSEMDEDPLQPLGVVLDYQASISPLISFQVNDFLNPTKPTLNFTSAMYVLHPYGLKHVVDKFCQHHIHRPCKHVFYYYDHTAIAERNMHKRMSDEVVEYFKLNGWKVTEMYMGKAPSQNLKYQRIQFWMENEEQCKFPIRINERTCATLVLSMDQTETKETEEGTKKDKSKERDKNYPQEQTTHFSDAFDMAVWGVLELKMLPKNEVSGGGVRFR